MRNIGGMIIIDFIDMESRVDKIAILEALELALEPDKAKPTVGQLSDLGLVELTRHRQGQSLSEIFTKKCPACGGTGHIMVDFNFANSPQEAEANMKNAKLNKIPQKQNNNKFQQNNNNNLKPDRLKNPQNQNQRTMQTNPSATAEAAETRQNQPQDNFVLTMNKVEDFFTKTNYYINVAKNIKIAAVPSSFIHKNLSNNYQKDVFTIIAELESDKEPVQVQQQLDIQPEETVVTQEEQTEQPAAVIEEQPKEEEKTEEKPKRGRRTTSTRKKKEESSESETTEIKQETEQTEEPKPKAKTVAKRPRRPRATKKATEEKEE